MARQVSGLMQSSSTQVTRLQSMATTDALTGLINRRLFNLQLQGEWSRARRHHSALCLALFDVDNFKKINDTYGHPVGDRILKELAALVAHNLRDSDIPARYGGEEFALILTETRQMEAAELMERVRVLIERHVFCLPDNPQTVTVSIGVAQFDPKAHTRPEDLVGQADAALYEAKHQGKNRVIYGVLPVPKVSYKSSRSTAVPMPFNPSY
jgi:diguanylate cyclase (GGDEF)-like protein